MAYKARLLVVELSKLLLEEDNALQSQLGAFRKHLASEMEPAEFADIYAQIAAYGMFAARLHDGAHRTFSREKVVDLIPTSNPFLRKFFQHISGNELDERIRWIIDDLAKVFCTTDVSKLMEDYGKSNQLSDPFLHFYETFLGEYDPKNRKGHGVYYTPKPAVDFIVRAVDEILKTEFDLADGLASKTTVGNEHRVQILDPATGTGTFLSAIIQHIHDKHFVNQKDAWVDYVKNHLIPRLNGFEVMVTPYAMAHIKLEMVLRETGYKSDNERLRVFLTNTLEDPYPDTLFPGQLSKESEEANTIKRDTRAMVIIGNPPYSGGSANNEDWIVSYCGITGRSQAGVNCKRGTQKGSTMIMLSSFAMANTKLTTQVKACLPMSPIMASLTI